MPRTARPAPLTALTRTSLPPVTLTSMPRSGRLSTRTCSAEVTTDPPCGRGPAGEEKVRLPEGMVIRAGGAAVGCPCRAAGPWQAATSRPATATRAAPMKFPRTSRTTPSAHLPMAEPRAPPQARPSTPRRHKNTPSNQTSMRALTSGTQRAEGAGLMRVNAPVVLEDKADGGQDHEKHADQEKPPSDRRADGSRGAGQPGEQRPPAVRAEEAKLARALGDLALRVVLGAQRQPSPGEQDVEAAEEGEPHGQRQRGGPRRVLRVMPVHDVGTGEEHGAADEQVPFDLHL